MSGRLALGLLLALAPAAPAVASVWNGFEAVDTAGRRWTAERLAGRVVLIDFWASWCAPCRAQIPTLRRASERFGADGFLVLGVSLDRTDRRRLAGFLRRHGIDWPQIHDGRGFAGAVARRFRVEAVPRTLLVDRAGRIVAVDLPGEALLAALPALLEAAGPGRRAADAPWTAKPANFRDAGAGATRDPGVASACSGPRRADR